MEYNYFNLYYWTPICRNQATQCHVHPPNPTSSLSVRMVLFIMRKPVLRILLSSVVLTRSPGRGLAAIRFCVINVAKYLSDALNCDAPVKVVCFADGVRIYVFLICSDADCAFAANLGNLHGTSARYSGLWICWRIVFSFDTG